MQEIFAYLQGKSNPVCPAVRMSSRSSHPASELGLPCHQILANDSRERLPTYVTDRHCMDLDVFNRVECLLNVIFDVHNLEHQSRPFSGDRQDQATWKVPRAKGRACLGASPLRHRLKPYRRNCAGQSELVGSSFRCTVPPRASFFPHSNVLTSDTSPPLLRLALFSDLALLTCRFFYTVICFCGLLKSPGLHSSISLPRVVQEASLLRAVVARDIPRRNRLYRATSAATSTYTVSRLGPASFYSLRHTRSTLLPVLRNSCRTAPLFCTPSPF
jgi:hypothetical protein